MVGSPNGELATGLTSGLYTAPVNEYIFPEPTRFGLKGFPVSVPFENFCFLAQGGGGFTTASGPVNLGRLDPFPDSGPVGNGTQRACDGQ